MEIGIKLKRVEAWRVTGNFLESFTEEYKVQLAGNEVMPGYLWSNICIATLRHTHFSLFLKDVPEK